MAWRMSRLDVKIASQIDRAVEILKAGGVVAYPTDTVYGLGADVFNADAVAKIYDVKRRPRTIPLPVLIAEAEQVKLVASSVSRYARLLMRHFWPGGLTLVLPKAASLPDIVTAGDDKVAVRLPDHIVPLTIVRRLGKPIIGTSANVSNRPSPLTAQEVEQQLAGQVDLIIDMGRCPGGIESTVVDVTGEAPVVLRQGIVPEEEVMEVFREYAKEVGKCENRSRL
jgi:L-threonylcarbamoyladenylate synthase